MNRKWRERLRRFRRRLSRLSDERHLVAAIHAPLGLGERLLHFWVLVWRTYMQNRCALRAAALSYATLLALVPLLAVLISISGSLLKRHGEEAIMKLVDEVVLIITPGMDNTPAPGSEEPATTATNLVNEASALSGESAVPATSAGTPADDQIRISRVEVRARIQRFIANIQTGALGIGGMIALLVLTVGLINRVEQTLNDIWGVHRGRPWHLRLAYYCAVLVLGPVLLALAMTLTGADYVQSAREFLKSHLPLGALLDRTFIGLLPFGVLSIACTLLYFALPNTRVKFHAALVGGVLAGCLWQWNNQLGALYASRVLTYSRIYGSVAMVPLLMLTLYLHWLILLLGAQVSYVVQHGRTYLEDLAAGHIPQRSRERLAFHIVLEAGRAFLEGRPPPEPASLAEQTRVPVRVVEEVIRHLVARRILHEVNSDGLGLAPARPLELLTVADVLSALRDGLQEPPPCDLITSLPAPLERLLAVAEQEARRLTLRELLGSASESSAASPPAEPKIVPAS